MTKQEFMDLTNKGPVFLDGAAGSNLQAAGMPIAGCAETWILDHPDVLIALQNAFAEGGAQILYAPTFTANHSYLKRHDLGDQVPFINKSLVELTRKAASGRALVAGDLTMTGDMVDPEDDQACREVKSVYEEQINALIAAGVDLLIVETMMSLEEAVITVETAVGLCDLPVMASMTFTESGRTFYGASPADAAQKLQEAGASAVGANCSVGPAQMAPWIREMKACSRIPILAKPNAGLPVLGQDGQMCYPMTPESFAVEAAQLTEAGAGLIGGCCGTTPEHLRALINLVKCQSRH